MQAILTIVAAYYAYRVTKEVGLFWAWGAVVAAFVLDAGSRIMSALSIFFIPVDQISALIAQFNSVQIWGGQVVSLASAFLLAAGMYGLLKIFRSRSSTQAQPGL